MNRTRRPLAALALISIGALISACGSSAPVATGSTGAGNATTAHKQAMKFAACMRSNGVGAFPDPSGSGGFTIDAVVNGSSLDPNAPAFKQAISACKNLEPAGFTGAKVTPQQTAARLKFAQCIRVNGVPDFPDPTPSEPLVDTNRIPSANRPGGMSALNAAMHKCGAVYAGELGLRGQFRCELTSYQTHGYSGRFPGVGRKIDSPPVTRAVYVRELADTRRRTMRKVEDGRRPPQRARSASPWPQAPWSVMSDT